MYWLQDAKVWLILLITSDLWTVWLKMKIIFENCPGFDELSRNSQAWWRHQMEAFSALLVMCAGNSPAPGVFPAQRPVTRSFGVFLDLRPNKQLSKQWRGWWFETPSSPLWQWNRLASKLHASDVLDGYLHAHLMHVAISPQPTSKPHKTFLQLVWDCTMLC